MSDWVTRRELEDHVEKVADGLRDEMQGMREDFRELIKLVRVISRRTAVPQWSIIVLSGCFAVALVGSVAVQNQSFFINVLGKLFGK